MTSFNNWVDQVVFVVFFKEVLDYLDVEDSHSLSLVNRYFNQSFKKLDRSAYERILKREHPLWEVILEKFPKWKDDVDTVTAWRYIMLNEESEAFTWDEHNYTFMQHRYPTNSDVSVLRIRDPKGMMAYKMWSLTPRQHWINCARYASKADEWHQAGYTLFENCSGFTYEHWLLNVTACFTWWMGHHFSIVQDLSIPFDHFLLLGYLDALNEIERDIYRYFLLIWRYSYQKEDILRMDLSPEMLASNTDADYRWSLCTVGPLAFHVFRYGGLYSITQEIKTSQKIRVCRFPSTNVRTICYDKSHATRGCFTEHANNIVLELQAEQKRLALAKEFAIYPDLTFPGLKRRKSPRLAAKEAQAAAATPTALSKRRKKTSSY